jgi:predicted MFS family arabinose efflux permease
MACYRVRNFALATGRQIMRALGADRTLVGALCVLSVAQLAGWGTIGLPAIVGRPMAADLQMDIAAAFAGTTVLYVMMGLISPLLAQPFLRFGTRRVMAAGTLCTAIGFVVLSLAQGPLSYFAAWVVLGIGGAATLTTAAHIVLNEIAGRGARSAIGALMLVTGLSSSIFWPITAVLSDALGWRGTCFVYALVMAAICCPLYLFGLPGAVAAKDETTATARVAAQPREPVARSTFILVVAAIVPNGFVTFGLASVLIELLKAKGLPASEAIAFGSSLGVLQISGRLIDFLGGGRWDGLTTGLVAATILPLGLLVLLFSNGSYWSIGLFVLLYGLGSGALAIARATIPLVFYDQADYAKVASRMALPLNVIAALSPPLLAGVLTRFGSGALLGLALLCSCSALPMLILLARRRSGSSSVA